MQSSMRSKLAGALAALGLALIAGGIALAVQQDPGAARATAPLQAPRAEDGATCRHCEAWSFGVRLPADMPVSEPIATY